MSRVRAWARRLRRRIGRRGASLLFFAFLDVVYAVAIATAPLTPTYVFLATVLPLPVWAAMWAAVGAVCAAGAFTRGDKLAFACASWIKVGWACVHAAGWVLGDLPRGWVWVVIWLAVAGFVQIIAGWAEPRRGP
jgi:hypothetical protein